VRRGGRERGKPFLKQDMMFKTIILRQKKGNVLAETRRLRQRKKGNGFLNPTLRKDYLRKNLRKTS